MRTRTGLMILSCALLLLAGAIVVVGLGASASTDRVAHAQAQLQAQVQTLRAQLAAVADKAAGNHRDLITCADLQGMGLQMLIDVNLTTDANGYTIATPDLQPVALPQHCINQ